MDYSTPTTLSLSPFLGETPWVDFPRSLKIQNHLHALKFFMDGRNNSNEWCSAVCWICLDGGADDTGTPIVRDCACRGDDAGFAHLSCIIKYAQKKCEQTSIEDVSEFIAPWETCPNCLQNYQNDLAVYIADAFVSFAKKEYGYPGNQLDDKMKFMEALRLQIQTNLSAAAHGPITREVMEARHMIENLIHKLLAIVDQAKEEHGMGPHMDPTSYEYHQYMCICLLYEAYGYQNLAQLYSVDQSDESTKSEIGYYTRARAIYDKFGYETDSKLVTGNIDRVRAEYEGDKERSLTGKKNMYQNRLESAGQNSEETILTGYNYGIGLMEAYHSIEAERLLTKLAAISRQVYGEDHNCTSKIA